MVNVDNPQELTFGSLFSGAGGLDLGLEQAGMRCTFQVENDKHCLTILNGHWPDVPKNQIRPCMGLVGGDPCPIRSNLGRSSRTSSPDMSGYFLAMAYRCKPRWILRENVCAPDVQEFISALEVLGYDAAIVEANGAAFTGQSRRREFVAGFDTAETRERFSELVLRQSNTEECCLERISKRKAIKCLNTRSRSGISIYHDFVFEGTKWGFRSLTHVERESLQGLPTGWTGGIPHSARERAVGNAVTVPVAKWLGERIKEALTEASPSRPNSPSGR